MFTKTGASNDVLSNIFVVLIFALASEMELARGRLLYHQEVCISVMLLDGKQALYTNTQ